MMIVDPHRFTTLTPVDIDVSTAFVVKSNSTKNVTLAATLPVDMAGKILLIAANVRHEYAGSYTTGVTVNGLPATILTEVKGVQPSAVAAAFSGGSGTAASITFSGTHKIFTILLSMAVASAGDVNAQAISMGLPSGTSALDMSEDIAAGGAVFSSLLGLTYSELTASGLDETEVGLTTTASGAKNNSWFGRNGVFSSASPVTQDVGYSVDRSAGGQGGNYFAAVNFNLSP